MDAYMCKSPVFETDELFLVTRVDESMDLEFLIMVQPDKLTPKGAGMYRVEPFGRAFTEKVTKCHFAVGTKMFCRLVIALKHEYAGREEELGLLRDVVTASPLTEADW